MSGRIAKAFSASGNGDVEPLLAPATRPEFGDYQANGAMPVAKRTKNNPWKVSKKSALWRKSSPRRKYI